jgi:phage tail sheath protein FI
VWRLQFDSSFAVTYFPWASVVDPIGNQPDTTRAVPFCGHALGQFALADAEPGRPAPANRLVAWTAQLTRLLDDVEHGALNMLGVNCVRVSPARGIRIMGARTLSSDPAWQQLTVRRLVIRLKRFLARALKWAVFEPNNQTLLDTLIVQIEGFLEGEWMAQRLTGATIEQAFYVRPIGLADDFDNGRLILEVGVAPSVPAEFVVLRLTRSEDRLDVAEQPNRGWPS